MFVEIIIDGHPCTINLQYTMEIYLNSFAGVITIAYHGPVSRKYQFDTAAEAKAAYSKILDRLNNGGVM